MINGRVEKERVEEGKNWGRESQGREELRGVKSEVREDFREG